MQLRRWKLRTRDDVERFALHWEKENAVAPDLFPVDMEPIEWLAHFVHWLELETST